ncbi:MAG: hypothetical protein ABS889_03840 [Desemzia incerta]
MDVINIKPIIVSLLKEIPEIKKVATEYPVIWTTFPAAIYRTTQTPYAIDADKNEMQTLWTVTIDLYAETSLTDIHSKVSEKMKSIGFVGNAVDSNNASLIRVAREFKAIVDNEERRVYQP